MAQSKVNDYFVTRKKTKGGEQSKRRRIEVVQDDDDISILKRNLRSTNTVDTINNNKAEITSKLVPEVHEKDRVKSKQRQTPISTSKRISRSAKTVRISDNQQLISNVFCPKTNSMLENDITVDVTNSTLKFQIDEIGYQSKEESTPKKQLNNSIETSSITRQRRKKDKLKDETPATPEAEVTKLKLKNMGSIRKQLRLQNEDQVNHDTEENEVVSSMVSQNVDFELPPKISPLPDTPDNIRQQAKGPILPTSPRVKAAIEKCKELQVDSVSSKPKTLDEEMQPENLRKQLRKCGKLEELKAQLLEMNKAIHKVKKTPKLQKFNKIKFHSPVESEKASSTRITESTVPAYEKYHSLASPSAPSLNLPLKYKRLAEIFRNMDTVVSMMHNRYEICTFSKLKNAVQVMTKKNFELNHVGHVQAVYPVAYHLKQEIGLPLVGSKTSNYQLTIEANLTNLEGQNKGDMKEKSDRIHFSATHMLERRNVFNNELINRVKYHHKNFLKNLDRPLNIPDEKITRWHPAFQLDQVPDIEMSELPQPPIINKYHTAKDVLDERRGKLTPKVEKALENVASQNSKNEKVDLIEEPKTVVPNNSAYRGIPASLLEKIRAKEAKKLELAMTRDPKEDKKTVMMARLPDLIRIIRMLFVTEKKPALLQDLVIKKLGDSTKSNLSASEINNHLKLLINMLPEWISMVEIKKGRYLKIDRNIDIHALSTKISNIVKARR